MVETSFLVKDGENSIRFAGGAFVSEDLVDWEADGDDFHGHHSGNEPNGTDVLAEIGLFHSFIILLMLIVVTLPHCGKQIFVHRYEFLGGGCSEPHGRTGETSDNSDGGLKTPMVDVSDHMNLPE